MTAWFLPKGQVWKLVQKMTFLGLQKGQDLDKKEHTPSVLLRLQCISDSARRGSFLFPSYLGRSKDLCVKGTPPGNELLKPNYILFSLRLLLIILFKTLKVYGFEWLTICDLGMQQYAYFIFRYLIPSHCLDCPKVVEQCPVRGCRQHCREGEMLETKKKMERHISLMESERTGILWNS